MVKLNADRNVLPLFSTSSSSEYMHWHPDEDIVHKISLKPINMFIVSWQYIYTFVCGFLCQILVFEKPAIMTLITLAQFACVLGFEYRPDC